MYICLTCCFLLRYLWLTCLMRTRISQYGHGLLYALWYNSSLSFCLRFSLGPMHITWQSMARSPPRFNIFHTVFVIEFQQPSAQTLDADDAIQACGILLYRNSYCHQRKKQGTPGHLTEASQDLPQHLVPSPAAVDQCVL